MSEHEGNSLHLSLIVCILVCMTFCLTIHFSHSWSPSLQTCEQMYKPTPRTQSLCVSVSVSVCVCACVCVWPLAHQCVSEAPQIEKERERNGLMERANML